MTINVIYNFFLKNAKIRDVKILKKIPLRLSKYTVTYHQTLEEAPSLLRPDKPKNRQKFSKNLKKFAIFFKKLQTFAKLKC